LHIFEPVERICLLKLPAHALVFRVPDRSARADNPTFRGRDKRDAVQIFRHRTRKLTPRHAAVYRVQNRSFVADHPTRFLTDKTDCIQRGGSTGRTDGPALTTSVSEEDLATRANGPTV